MENYKLKSKAKIITIYGLKNSGKTLMNMLLIEYLIKNINQKIKVLIIDLNKIKSKKYYYFLQKNNNKKNKVRILNFEFEKNKLNYNLDLISKFNFLFSKKIKQKEKNNIIKKIINENIDKYDFIMIDVDYSLNKVSKQIIFKNSDIKVKTFLKNKLGFKELEEIFNECKRGYQNEKNSLHIVKNKIDFLSIDTQIVEKVMEKNVKIIKINYKKIYNYFIKNFDKSKINKKTEEIIKKIIN